MNWRVTYRAKDGKQAVEVIEAASRNDVFKVIASKGISAIRVEEANGKTRPLKSSSGSPKKVVVGLLTAILVAAGVIYVSGVYKGNSSEKDKPAKTKITKNSTIREVSPQTNSVVNHTSVVKPKRVSEEDNTPPRQKIVEMISVITNADGSVLERFRTADGKIRSRQSAPKPVFDNASDQIIAMAASGAASGYAMPPMPVMNNADEEFLKSLEKEIKVNDDDTDEVKALKQNVIAIREEIRQLMSEGHSFAEVIKDHRDIVNHGVEMRKEASRIIKDFLDNGDNEAANECLEKVNEVLAGMGIQGVEMPLTDEERREKIRSQKRNGN